MSKAELKIDLINRITSISDKAKLNELLYLLKFQSDHLVYPTNSEEKEEIKLARKEIDDGKVIPDSDVKEEIGKWLNK
jgi:hypothetical protein